MFGLGKPKKEKSKIVKVGKLGMVAFNVKSGATKGPHQFGLSEEGIDVIKALQIKVFAVIKYTDIEDIEIKINENEINKNKSVVGRAFVGGVLTGGVGAIIGGMSGLGTNTKITLDIFLKIKLKDGRTIELERLNLKGNNTSSYKYFVQFLEHNFKEANNLNVCVNEQSNVF